MGRTCIHLEYSRIAHVSHRTNVSLSSVLRPSRYSLDHTPSSCTMRSCYRAFLLACALVFSFCISFVFSKGPQFNDWHYEYRVLSYGPNKQDKLDQRFPQVPSRFISSSRSRQVQVMSPGQHDLIDYSFLAQNKQ